MRNLFMYLLAGVNLISIVHLGAYVVGANLYDIKSFRQARRRARKAPHTPLVSIVIPAHNEAAVIERTLDSVRASSYKNIQVIVVDDGSTDRTGKIVQNYIENLYHEPVMLVRQRNKGKAAAMNNAIMNYVQGEYFMCLDADSILHPEAVKRAVDHLKDPSVIGVAANVRIIETKTALGMLQRFEHLVGYRAKKFYSLTNSEFVVGGVASTYRTEIIKGIGGYDTDTMTEDIGLSLKLIAKHGNKSGRVIYAADVVAMTEGVQTFGQLLRQRYRWKMGNLQNLFKYRALFGRTGGLYGRMLTWYRLPMAVISECLLLLMPLLLGYLVYLTVRYHTPNVFIGAYLTSTLYTLWNLWPDEHLSTRQKLKMSALSVFMYLLYFIMDAVQIYSVFRALRNYKKIIGREHETGTWTSPKRAGARASFTST